MDLERLKALIDLVSNTRVAELEVVEDGVRVRIVASAREGAAPTATVSRVDEPSGQIVDPEAETVVEAQLYGILYLAPGPEEPAFVSVGDTVEQGQTLCMIESMKVLSPVPSPVTGKIVAVLGESGSEVESGQPLFQIK